MWVLKIAGAVPHHHPDECAAGSSVSRPGDEGGGRTKEQGSSIRMYTWIKVEKKYIENDSLEKWKKEFLLTSSSLSTPPPFFGRCSASITERPPPDWSQSWCSFFFLSWASINTSPRLLTGERCPLILYTWEKVYETFFFLKVMLNLVKREKMRSLEAACAAASMRTAWCLHKRTSFFFSLFIL